MSVPISQKKLIEKYFNALVKEFIIDSRHNKNINIVFVDYIESSKPNSKTMGQTEQSGGGSRENQKTTWTVINGVKVPGSEKITTTITYDPYKYVITFLNHYKDEEELRGTVVHEFTHLYIYATVGGKHDHDKRFYSTMEFMENWLNKNQGLSPRVDKSRDYDQYEDNHSKTTVDNQENICSECSYPSPYHSPQCSQNQNNPHPTNRPNQKPNITNDFQKAAELDRLKKLLESSRDLTILEKTYQSMKINPFYQEENNKKILDTFYETKKNYFHFQPPINNQRFSNNAPDSPNKNGWGGREYFLIILVAMIIVLIVIIGYLLISENQTPTKPKQKR